MPFTGTATVTSLGAHIVRITGLSLGASAVGTIGNYGDSLADVQLPSNFPGIDANRTIVTPNFVSTAGRQLLVSKGGTPIRITVTNDIASASGGIEFYVNTQHTLPS